MELFNFLKHREIARKTLIFFLKNGLSRQPNSDQSIATELVWRSIVFLRSSCWQFFALSKRFQSFNGAHNACTVLSWHSNNTDRVLKMKYVCLVWCFTSLSKAMAMWGRSVNHFFSWASLTKRLNSTLCTYFCLSLKTKWHLKECHTVSLCTCRAPIVPPIAQWRPYCVAMLTLMRPHCAVIRTPSDGLCLSMLKVSTVVRCSMRSHCVYWQCHCLAAVMLAIILRAPWSSPFFLDAMESPWERCSGVRGI